MKKILKSRLFTFALGLIVAGSIGVCAYTISSSDVSYDNSTSGLEADNVNDALDNLYDMAANAGSTLSIVELGTAASYNISELYPDIDYTKLTLDNFFYKISDRAFGNVTSNMRGSSSAAFGVSAPTVSYDNTTGVVTFTQANINTIGGENTPHGYFTTVYVTSTLYMIMP